MAVGTRCSPAHLGSPVHVDKWFEAETRGLTDVSEWKPGASTTGRVTGRGSLPP